MIELRKSSMWAPLSFPSQGPRGGSENDAYEYHGLEPVGSPESLEHVQTEHWGHPGTWEILPSPHQHRVGVAVHSNLQAGKNRIQLAGANRVQVWYRRAKDSEAERNGLHPNEIQVVHAVKRCVRQVFLCGLGKNTGNDYEHRRQWIRDRFEFLASLFASTASPLLAQKQLPRYCTRQVR